MAGNDAAVLEAIRDAVGQAGAHGVFGEAVTQDGVTVLPVARLSGGGGGGSGEGNQPGGKTDASGRGNGGGFGVSARPVGAFVIRDGTVSWQPAVDVNKIILGGQVVFIVALLVARTIIKIRRRRRR